MATTTTPTSGAADMLELIEAYAEARHRQGHSSYNAKTAAALQAVKDALAAGQATAAPAQPAAQQGVAYAALPDLSDADGEIWRAIIYWGHAKRGEDALRKASELERVLSDQMRAFADATHALRASHGQAPAGATLPDGWVPLTITHEGQYPEEVAYGPQIMMDRLGKWLGKYFAQAAQADSELEDAAREPLQIFDSPRAKALMRAFEEGWAACRDAEFVGEDAQNDAFNQSATVNVCLAEDWTAAAERAARKQGGA